MMMGICSAGCCATGGGFFAAFGGVWAMIGWARLAEDPRLFACFIVAT